MEKLSEDLRRLAKELKDHIPDEIRALIILHADRAAALETERDEALARAEKGEAHLSFAEYSLLAALAEEAGYDKLPKKLRKMAEEVCPDA